MDERYPDAAALAKQMKERASPRVPFSMPPRDCYHFFPNGLSLCLTVDLLSREGLIGLAQRFGVKVPVELVEGNQYWHLSIARVGSIVPSPEEVEFWRKTFFEEEPIVETRGLLTSTHTRHFFWRYQRPGSASPGQ